MSKKKERTIMQVYDSLQSHRKATAARFEALERRILAAGLDISGKPKVIKKAVDEAANS